MSKIQVIPVEVKPVGYSKNGFAKDATGDNFVITQDGPNDDCSHYVLVTNLSKKDHSDKSLTLSGFAANKEAISDIIPLPKPGKTERSNLPFARLTLARPSASVGNDKFDIGWSSECFSRWLAINGYPSVHDIVIHNGDFKYAIEYAHNTQAALIGKGVKRTQEELLTSDSCHEFGLSMPALTRLYLEPGDNSRLVQTIVFSE